MAVLSAIFSHRIVRFQDFLYANKESKRRQIHNENSIVANIATTDWTIVPKMEHPVSQKLKTVKSKFFIDMLMGMKKQTY